MKECTGVVTFDHVVVAVNLPASSLCNRPHARLLNWDQHVLACTCTASLRGYKEARHLKEGGRESMAL